MKSIKTEARSGAINNHNNYIVSHPMDKQNDAITNFVRWIKSARTFRKNTKKVGSRRLDIFINELKIEKYERQRIFK